MYLNRSARTLAAVHVYTFKVEMAQAEERDVVFVRRMLRSLLVSEKNGLTPKQLVRDYQRFVGEAIPLSSLGFKSLMQLVSSMPDVIQVQKRAGGILLRGIPDESVKHIARMVKRQRQRKFHKPQHSRPANQLNTASPVEPALPVEFRARVKRLMMCYGDGVPLRDFLEAYRKRYGPELRRFRFGDLVSALLSLSDVIRVKPDEEKTEMMVYSIDKSEMKRQERLC